MKIWYCVDGIRLMFPGPEIFGWGASKGETKVRKFAGSMLMVAFAHASALGATAAVDQRSFEIPERQIRCAQSFCDSLENACSIVRR